MHLVNDVHFVLPFDRRVLRIFTEFANVVHAVVRCTVNFYHVHRAPGVYLCAGSADIARLKLRRGILTVHRFGENTRRRSLAYATRTIEDIRMVYASRLHGIAQRPRDVFLPDDISEALGSPFAGGDDVLFLRDVLVGHEQGSIRHHEIFERKLN